MTVHEGTRSGLGDAGSGGTVEAALPAVAMRISGDRCDAPDLSPLAAAVPPSMPLSESSEVLAASDGGRPCSIARSVEIKRSLFSGFVMKADMPASSAFILSRVNEFAVCKPKRHGQEKAASRQDSQEQ